MSASPQLNLDLWFRVQAFLVREARLKDDHQLTEWL